MHRQKPVQLHSTHHVRWHWLGSTSRVPLLRRWALHYNWRCTTLFRATHRLKFALAVRGHLLGHGIVPFQLHGTACVHAAHAGRDGVVGPVLGVRGVHKGQAIQLLALRSTEAVKQPLLGL